MKHREFFPMVVSNFSFSSMCLLPPPLVEISLEEITRMYANTANSKEEGKDRKEN